MEARTIVRAGFVAWLIALALLTAACSRIAPAQRPEAPSRPGATSMGGMGSPAQPQDMAPPVKGFFKGEEILFIHTEASDQQVASMLTRMMGPQVVLVPQLAQAPESLLASVYVFTNGVTGDGPFGFQADVFDTVPGDAGYSPLRMVNPVTWKEGVTARELRSVEEVRDAESEGKVAVRRSGVVVNMPILAWPGGRR